MKKGAVGLEVTGVGVLFGVGWIYSRTFPCIASGVRS